MGATRPVAATALFLAAVISDALTALHNGLVRAPASLRGASLVLMACLAAPVLCNPKRGVYGHWQRPFVGGVLLLAAMLGMHQGDADVRTADAAYALVVGYSCVWLFSAGGVDEQAKAVSPSELGAAVKRSATLLASATLLYASLRLLRAGLVHASAADGAAVAPLVVVDAANATAFTFRAYAHATETATLAVSFGGAVGIGAALVLFYNAESFAGGLGAVTPQAAVAALSAAAAAVVATLAASEQPVELPELFGPGACVAASGECAAAAEGRRFAVANTQSDGAWLVALGLAALAVPSRRTRGACTRTALYDWSVAIALYVALVVVFVAILAHCTFVGPQSHVDTVALAVVAGTGWAVVFDQWTGVAICAVAYVGQLVLSSLELGAVAIFTQLTNVTLACSTGALVLLLLLDALAAVCVVRWHAAARAVLVVAGASIALLLLLATSCLTLAYSGRLYEGEIHAIPPARQALKWLLQHYLPVLVWAPVFCTTDASTRVLARWVYRLVWVGAAVDVGIVYAIVLAALEAEAPAMAYVDAAPFATAVVGVALLPWGLCGRV